MDRQAGTMDRTDTGDYICESRVDECLPRDIDASNLLSLSSFCISSPPSNIVSHSNLVGQATSNHVSNAPSTSNFQMAPCSVQPVATFQPQQSVSQRELAIFSLLPPADYRTSEEAIEFAQQAYVNIMRLDSYVLMASRSTDGSDHLIQYNNDIPIIKEQLRNFNVSLKALAEFLDIPLPTNQRQRGLHANYLELCLFGSFDGWERLCRFFGIDKDIAAEERRLRRNAQQRERRAKKKDNEAALAARREQRAQRESQEDAADRVERLARDAESRRIQRDWEDSEQRAARLASVRAPRTNNSLQGAGFAYDKTIDYCNHPAINIGTMSRVCRHCRAKLFEKEAPSICCNGGKCRIKLLESPPELIMQYYSGDRQEHRQFLDHLRAYNACFAMTSFGGKETAQPVWQPTYSIQGQIYHRIGTLLPDRSAQECFLQIYFLGEEDQLTRRGDIFRGTHRSLVDALQTFLLKENHLIKQLRTTREQMPEQAGQIVLPARAEPIAGVHPGRLNAPTVNDTAILIVDGEQKDSRDIIIHTKDQTPHQISEFHPYYDALQYPLIFWDGRATWSYDLKQYKPNTSNHDELFVGGPETNRNDMRRYDPSAQNYTNKTLTALEYYAHLLMVREDKENFLLKCGRLLNQFVVDMYAKIESSRLLYLRHHQEDLRAADYLNLYDAMQNDEVGRVESTRVILPSTFIGSPRHKHEYAQDCAAYVRSYGRPDLFITITCNQDWREIKEHLFPGQRVTNRCDIINRVFKLKQDKLIHILTKDNFFGESVAYCISVEWQKRGNPHAHLLLWLKNKIAPSQIDDYVCAELPKDDPELFNIVSKCMIHNPCVGFNETSSCIDQRTNKCTKHFPKQFREETVTTNSYPEYQRRGPNSGGVTFVNDKGLTIDNSWVVPYNKVLSRMFKCHINVEICNSIQAIKYIFKYINKGSDLLQFDARPSENEVESYLLGRYISSSEAVWRMFKFSLHQRKPAIMRLHVHLENGQRVYFQEGREAQAATSPPRTTLTEFFRVCTEEPELTNDLLYIDVPKHYVWLTGLKRLKRRCPNSPTALGRMYTVHPNNQECFYLRMLLTTVCSPKSYEDIRTVDGVICDTFRLACQRLGLLEEDDQWKKTLQEAVADRSPPSIRHLFALIITNCNPTDPLELWNQFKEHMSEDILHTRRILYPDMDIVFCDDIFNQALIRIEDLTMRMVGKSLSQLGLPEPDRGALDLDNVAVADQLNYNRQEQDEVFKTHFDRLTAEQSAVATQIIDALDNDRGGIFFLDAPGGTGKTFLTNALLAYVRSNGQIALAVAASGIAATLMKGGRTAHSTFGIPIDLDRLDRPNCHIKMNSAYAGMLEKAKLIIWDECTMSHRKAVEAVDRSLQDIRKNTQEFGGALIVFSGDFRQTLPVVKRGTPADQINACLKESHLWRKTTRLQLTTNMRVHLNSEPGSELFCRQLLEVGEARCPSTPRGLFPLTGHNFCQVVSSLEALIDRIFPNLLSNLANAEWLCERAILAPLNVSATELNDMIQDRMTDAYTKTYLSRDKCTNKDEAVNYTSDILNSFTIPALPPHKLVLKVGSPIMLIRNLNPPRLCNGTRLRITALRRDSILATIITGSFRDEKVVIPRIPLTNNEMGVEFERLQFPIRLSFAMTINKAQGQSLRYAGVALTTPCFTHGQLYVACSRVGSPSRLIVYAPGNVTRNVVYPGALT